MKFATLTAGLALVAAGISRAESIPDPYPAAYAASLQDRYPLLVFVGQPARDVAGTRSISVPTFPEATGPSVVVGVVRNDGQMVRSDLNASATAPDIQTAISGLANPSMGEALDEVNAARATRGLRPYVRDAYLTAGAIQAAEFRAARLIEGHTANDFAALPPGGFATSAGCAAWEPGMGWGSCCTYENHTYAGAAYCYGRDGRRYMHLFVR
jgi:hypothetical protein